MTSSVFDKPVRAEQRRKTRLNDVIRRPGIAHVLFILAACSLSMGTILLTRGTGDVAAVWPVNAILLIVVLRWPKAEWPSLFGCLFIGFFLANVSIGDPWVRSLILAMANSLEVLIVALILSRHSTPNITRKSGILRLFAASLIACSISTPIALAGLALTGAALPLQDSALWFFGDILGLLLFAPLLWALLKKLKTGNDIGWMSALEALLVVVVTIGVFMQSNYPLLFLVPPVLVPLTLRHGVRGAAVALLIVTMISIGFTYAGMGPTMLADGGIVHHMLILQAFLAANAYMALSLGASVSERHRLTQRLSNSRRRIVGRSTREKVLLAQAEMADEISQVGHWTLQSGTGEVYWSPEVYRIHGVSPATFDPMLSGALDFYVEDDRERVAGLIAHHLENGGDWNVEATIMRRSDGEKRRVRSIAKCHIGPTGSVERIFGVFKDITQEHALYNALAAKEEQYRLLAEHSTDIVLKFGLDGVISYASPSASIIAPPEQAIGKRTVDFVVPEDREFAMAITQELFSGREGTDPNVQREFRVRLNDGSIIWLEGNPQIIRDKAGKAVEVVSTYRDVSERHEREKALAEARLQAESAMIARTEFLSNMSHEIRTPLNGVMGFTDILKTTALTDDQLAYVQRISSASRTLLEIINDILDFSKIDAGRMEVESRPFDIREMIEDVVSLVAAARPNPKVKIACQVAPEIATVIVGDETRLRQILTNIVGNAAKFTEAGHVRLDARLTDGRLCVIVADTGPGIPGDKMDHIFTGFSQADASITRRFGGSGLGLSISRSLALLLDGNLELVSEEGVGTNAILTLPYIPDRRTGRVEAPDLVDGRRAPSAARIMVVDDVEMNRALIAIGLRSAGHEVTTFASAPDAILSLLEGAMYDMILMDVQMPEMDGLTATRRIREMHGPTGRLPIVALTANALATQADECLAAGMDAHFSKPIDMVRLNNLIERFLRKKGAETEERSTAAEAMIAALKEDCRRDILELPGKLGALLRISSPETRAQAVASLAHSVAGTSGSLGFKDVSDAAFKLEAVAKEILSGTPVPDSLEHAVESFVSVVEDAA